MYARVRARMCVQKKENIQDIIPEVNFSGKVNNVLLYNKFGADAKRLG